jgi:hypothetical protein
MALKPKSAKDAGSGIAVNSAWNNEVLKNSAVVLVFDGLIVKVSNVNDAGAASKYEADMLPVSLSVPPLIDVSTCNPPPDRVTVMSNT